MKEITEKFNEEIETLQDLLKKEVKLINHRSKRFHVVIGGEKIGSSKGEKALYPYLKGLINGAAFAAGAFPFDK